MALTYSTAIQNRIALAVWSNQNGNLSTDQKVQLDGTWVSPAALTTGVAFDAFNKINRVGQWFEQVTANIAPQVWEDWLVAETAKRLLYTVRPGSETAIHWKNEAIAAEEEAFASYSSTDPTSTTIGGQSVTTPGVLWYVVDHCIRRKPRLFPSPNTVYSHIGWVLNYIWNRTSFNFRKRQCTLSISQADVTAGTWVNGSLALTETAAFNGFPPSESITNAPAIFAATGGTSVIPGPYQIATRTSDDSIVLSVSLSSTAGNLTAADITGVAYATRIFGLAASETMDSTNVREFTYTDDGSKLCWRSADDMASLRAYFGTSTGKPQYFRIEVRGSTLFWHLLPLPDDDYTLHGEVLASGPTALTDATTLTTAMGRFPPEFAPIIRDGVLARTLRAYDTKDGESKWQEVENQVETLLAVYEDTGKSDDDQTIRDVYHDASYQVGNSDWNIGGRM